VQTGPLWLNIFRHIRMVAKRAYELHHVHPSVRLSAHISMDRFL